MSDMWNEMFSAPHSVDEEYDQTWPYAFKWGFDPDTNRVDVWRVQGGTDGRPTHRREIQDRWGRPPSLQGGDVMGLASYIPAEIKIDGTIVAPPEIHTQTYYDKPTPPQIIQYFQEQFPHAIVRDAIIAPSKGQVFGKTAEFEPTWKSPQSTLKWVWNEKNGLLLWQADANNLPTHNQKTLAEWNRHTSPHSEGDALGYAYSGPEKVEVESYDDQPIAPAAFAAVKSQLAEWFPNHQIIGDNQAQREFGSDPVDYRSAALTWAWENLSDDPAERSHSSSETTERRPRLLTRLFSKTVTADADMEGCMVALFVPEKAAKKLKVRRGEPVENMHITLLYFSDKIADRDDWDKVQRIVEQVANQSPPLSGIVSGYGVFNADEGDVLWASPSVQGLAELRHKIYEACEDAGFHTDTEHDWVPHITLKYKHRSKLPKGEIKLDFPELSFAQGDDQHHYEFTGNLEKRADAWDDALTGEPEEYFPYKFLVGHDGRVVGGPACAHETLHDWFDLSDFKEAARGEYNPGGEMTLATGQQTPWPPEETARRVHDWYATVDDPDYKFEPNGEVWHSGWTPQQGWERSRFKLGNLEKTTMAEQTGDPELDSVLNNFQWERADWWDWSDHPDWDDKYEPQIADFENSDLSTGHCYYASEKLVNFLKQNGIEAELKTVWNRHDLPEIGYSDTPNTPQHDAHTVVVIERPSGTYMVDFTASQMGYQEHPMVQRLDDQGDWQRKWGSAAPEPPNYREQEKSNEACGLCKMMSEGKCWGYGNKPVEPDMVCDSFSPETKKTSAAGQVMYHAAPVKYREEILSSGIAPRSRGLEYGPGPSGTFLYPYEEQARRWAQDQGLRDVYEINVEGLPLDSDMELYEAGAKITSAHISPERIRLLNEHTASNDYLDWSGWEGAHRFVTDGKEILTDPETEPIDDSQWRDSELEDKFRTIYPEAKSLVSGWTVPTADGMGLGIWAPAAGHGDKHEPGLHEIIGVVEKELGKPTHLITNKEHLQDSKMYATPADVSSEWQTLSHKLTKPS